MPTTLGAAARPTGGQLEGVDDAAGVDDPVDEDEDEDEDDEDDDEESDDPDDFSDEPEDLPDFSDEPEPLVAAPAVTEEPERESVR